MDDFIEFVEPARVPSPCVNVCVIDPASGLCRGCARTLDEIARWTSMSDSERGVVLERVAERRGAIDGCADRVTRR